MTEPSSFEARRRPPLRDRVPWFCGHCAAPAPSGAAPAPTARVCPHAGLGSCWRAGRTAVPSNKDAFLVVDSSLLVQGVSRGAETFLGMSEERRSTGRVAELLVPADAEAQGRPRFAAAVAEAPGGEDCVGSFVRPWNTFGVRMRRRIATCGPPRAALLVIESGAPSPRPRGLDATPAYSSRRRRRQNLRRAVPGQRLGQTTEPSSRCPFSSSAMIVRPTPPRCR